MNDKVQTLIGFMKLLFIIFIAVHWTSCIFFAIGVSEIQDGGSSWISHTFDLNEPVMAWEFYTTTVYFALLTMATIGYGDIVPLTNAEKVFTCFVLLIACSLFAYILGSINSWFDKGETLIEELK